MKSESHEHSAGPLAATLAAAAMLLGGCVMSPGSRQPIPPGLGAVERRLTSDCAAARFSGVVAVARAGEVIFLHSCGFADAEQRVPITPAARFKLFSLSKPFTAAAILRLVDERHLELDRSIRDYVPEVPADWAPVTLRHLLQHRSGIPDHTEALLAAYLEHGDRTHDAAMRRVLGSLSATQTGLSAAPGSGWNYSNFGYELLALAGERAAGRPFHQVLRRYVFTPARMPDASVERAESNGELSARPSPGLVRGYVGSPERWEGAQSYSFVQQGAGALHGSYRDLLAFDAALSRGRVVSPQMQRRNVAESVVASDDVRYGFGWLIRTTAGCTYWQHSGGTNGYVSDFARVPEKGIAVVVLSNLGFASASEIRRDILRALLEGEGNGCASDG